MDCEPRSASDVLGCRLRERRTQAMTGRLVPLLGRGAAPPRPGVRPLDEFRDVQQSHPYQQFCGAQLFPAGDAEGSRKVLYEFVDISLVTHSPAPVVIFMAVLLAGLSGKRPTD
jgi:hypothetical protein